MILEWECTLDCNFKCGYCTNGRNTVLPKPIFHPDLYETLKFLEEVHSKYPDLELFVFGGEPLLHPHINEIIDKLNSLGQPFVIQTNFSQIKRLKRKAQLQVSVHRTQIKDLKGYISDLKENLDIIRTIDVMFTDEKDIRLAKEIKQFFPKVKIAPVADFTKDNRTTYLKALEKFNRYKRVLPELFEEGERSFIWEKNEKGLLSSKGKPCMYKGKYVLYSPDLKEYNCSHRLKTNICPFDRCFRM